MGPRPRYCSLSWDTHHKHTVLLPAEWTASQKTPQFKVGYTPNSAQTAHKQPVCLALTEGGDTDTVFCCESHSWITEPNITMQQNISACRREPGVKPQAVNHEQQGGLTASRQVLSVLCLLNNKRNQRLLFKSEILTIVCFPYTHLSIFKHLKNYSFANFSISSNWKKSLQIN